MDAPTQPPKDAYVVMNHLGAPMFSAPTFERAAERVTALLRSGADGGWQDCFRIVRVEGE